MIYIPQEIELSIQLNDNSFEIKISFCDINN